MMRTASRRTLSQILTAPGKVAHALDWRKGSGGSILSMSIGKGAIDIAVSYHPECQEVTQVMPSIPITTHVVNEANFLCPEVADEVSGILHDWKICGLVVSWPVQKEGWCGAACGRVLFTLDQLLNSPAGSGITDSGRKVCLWNNSHKDFSEDQFGRTSLYSLTSDKRVHYASEEQYQSSETVAAEVWDDFCRTHWPILFSNKCDTVWSDKSGFVRDLGSDDWQTAFEEPNAHSRSTL